VHVHVHVSAAAAAADCAGNDSAVLTAAAGLKKIPTAELVLYQSEIQFWKETPAPASACWSIESSLRNFR